MCAGGQAGDDVMPLLLTQNAPAALLRLRMAPSAVAAAACQAPHAMPRAMPVTGAPTPVCVVLMDLGAD